MCIVDYRGNSIDFYLDPLQDRGFSLKGLLGIDNHEFNNKCTLILESIFLNLLLFQQDQITILYLRATTKN